MIGVEETALVLLAAGRSTRFGAASKLAAPLGGRPLGLYAAETLADLPFLARVAVIGPDRPLDYAARGFETVVNPARDAGMATSLRAGVQATVSRGAAAVLVALADMPCVTAAHVARLFAASGGADTVVASSDGRTPKPPALFGAAHFGELMRATGDHGARDLIRAARLVVAAPDELADIDTPEDLARAAIRGAARRSD